MNRVRVLMLCAVTTTSSLLAGSYSRIADCDPAGCAAGITYPALEQVPPFAITHVPGYDGAEGAAFQFRICVALGSEPLLRPTQRAIDTWNALVPMTENCENCDLWETAPPGRPNTLHAESVILHEL